MAKWKRKSNSVPRIKSQIFFYSLWVSLGSLVGGCVKDPAEYLPVEEGREFFPLQPGQFTVFRVDSIYHDQPQQNEPGIHDTTSYLLKEVVDELFIDDSGAEAFVVERYTRFSDTAQWQLLNVYTTRIIENRAERVEENLRYVRMVFPVREGVTWNGNLYNILEPWNYTYQDLGMVRNLPAHGSVTTVRVNQRNEVNSIRLERAEEIYARELGLIEKREQLLDTYFEYGSNPVSSNIRLGYERFYTWLESGVE